MSLPYLLNRVVLLRLVGLFFVCLLCKFD